VNGHVRYHAFTRAGRVDVTRRVAVASGGARFLGDQVAGRAGRRDDEEEDCNYCYYADVSSRFPWLGAGNQRTS